MLNDSCNCCDSKRLVKCKGSSHGILSLNRKLSLTCCAHKGCTIFRWLNDFHIKTSFFVVAFCLCYIKSGVVGIRCPVQAECDFLLCTIFSFVLLERSPRLPRSTVKWALLPTVLYGGIILWLNIQRVVDGPYPFMKVYDQSVQASVLWCIAILLMNYFYAWLLWKLNGGKKEKA